MFKQGSRFPAMIVGCRDKALAYPCKGIVRIERLRLVECLVCELRVLVVQIEQSKVRPGSSILRGIQSASL